MQHLQLALSAKAAIDAAEEAATNAAALAAIVMSELFTYFIVLNPGVRA